ncbi:methyltransferase [Sphingomonas sp.]|uniref:class I SAM-dependent methyltransferase n=1 Tax=Sphingomonas sp. TaxID=28214 RepID=UPI0025E77362|nr:methyltransferase [Sphingomonas sp.]
MRQYPFVIAAIAVVGISAPLAVQARPAVLAARTAIDAAVAAPSRTPANRARDSYRHPAETLAFFGIKPGDKIVELFPSGGWYTEVLAPFVNAGNGSLIVAGPAGKADAAIATKLATNLPVYGKVTRARFPSTATEPGIVANSVDAVLTFRNIHNLTMSKEDISASAFRQMFAMLKPGGVLGIEEHRLPENMDSTREKTSGYLKVSTVKALAAKAGFQFAGSSEVNANPRDTHDYPKGVWTLPPNYAEGDADRARYAAIGESDRMTLKFVKPRK